MSNMRKKHYLCTAEQESGGSANPACVSVNKNSVAKALVSMISVWQN